MANPSGFAGSLELDTKPIFIIRAGTVLKWALFFVLLFVVVVFLGVADFALWTLIGSRPNNTLFVVSRTILGPVHADAFSFENANILLRHVTSTRKR